MVSDDFSLVVKVTAEVTEVEESALIADCRYSEVIEARIIVMKILSDMGYSPQRLAKYFHKSEQGIRLILSMYEDRHKNALMSKMEKEIRKKIESKSQETR